MSDEKRDLENQVKSYMSGIAEIFTEALPEGTGFIVMLSPKPGHSDYFTNVAPETAVKMLIATAETIHKKGFDKTDGKTETKEK